MTNNQKIRVDAAKAAKIVKSWPVWKQNLLTNSLKSTNDYCRVPIRKGSKPTSGTPDHGPSP